MGMYSESDLNSAVEAGVVPAHTAAQFRAYVAATRQAPAVDEESFRLLTGFNDIFVAVATVALLVGVAWLGEKFWLPLGGAAVATVSWPLAEYFSRRRRMALPSILLLLAFVGGVAASLIGAMTVFHVDEFSRRLMPDNPDAIQGLFAAGIAAVAALAAWLHWRRFMVPITVAAGAVAASGVIIAPIVAFAPQGQAIFFPLAAIAGVAVFALAMWWDMSDLDRHTRRSDVAFWLHLAAAPMIAHSIFHMLGVFGGNMTVAMAGVVIALYIAFALVALAVDRRALLVSSLAYVLYAMYALFQHAQAVELSAALTAIVIGSALLMLSAFWHPMRGAVVNLLGGLRHRLPPVQMPVAA
jgi:hypothetical protein